MSESKDITNCRPSDKHSGDTSSVIRLSLQIKALDEDGDVRALDADGKPIKPATVQSYLQRAFKSRLSDAERALKVSASLKATQVSCNHVGCFVLVGMPLWTMELHRDMLG